MKLSEILSSLANNANSSIGIYDLEENLLIKFMAAGYTNVEDSLQKRVVKKIKVLSSEDIRITITDDTEGGGTVAVTGVSVNQTVTTLSVAVGATVDVNADVQPRKATNTNVTWASSDESVATVDGGAITGVAAGTADITVTTEDGGFTATVAVTVA